MLLAVNVGNTETKLGVFHDRELSFSRRIGTHPERTADELALLFGGFLAIAASATFGLRSIAVASSRRRA